MIFNIILVIVIVLGAVLLGWVIFKKLPQLRILDPKSLPESHSKELKHEIIKKRVERVSGQQLKKIQRQVVNPVGTGLQNFIRRIAGKLTAVERRYQEKKNQSGQETKDRKTLEEMVKEGKKLMSEELWDRAEKKFIEVIGADPKHADAYEHLGRLYLLKKEFNDAKKTFQFLSKLSPNDPSVIVSVGEVEAMLGQHARALSHFKKAVELSPKNPKYLDFLITSAIENENVNEAMSALDRLKEVNPDNKKIETFEKRIAKIRPGMQRMSSEDLPEQKPELPNQKKKK